MTWKPTPTLGALDNLCLSDTKPWRHLNLHSLIGHSTLCASLIPRSSKSPVAPSHDGALDGLPEDLVVAARQVADRLQDARVDGQAQGPHVLVVLGRKREEFKFPFLVLIKTLLIWKPETWILGVRVQVDTLHARPDH